MRTLRLLRDQSPLGGILRALLTFVALADAALSLEVWVLKHREAHALAGAVQGAVSSLGFLAALAMAGAALYLATRPKQAFQRILVVLTVVAAVLSVTAGQSALIRLAALVGPG